ncbi:MAG: monovalent cation/H(+) antiporter subunit G [Deltaproteobacteria bacterium]|nr:monovalent cation/H(+) antiporter subunit G [Deltaproteobacteria bacterium]
MVDVLSVLLIACGIFLFASGTLGLLRLPDFYCRMHATGKCDTLGALLVLLGLAVYQGFSLISVKLLFIVVFIFLANPTATHAIGRAAFVRRVRPWTKDSPEPPASEAEEDLK